jgi:hypothetical protein
MDKLKYRNLMPFIFYLIGILIIAMTVTFPSSIFAANINCNQVPDPCNGTDTADTMTASDLGDNTIYNINGLGGSDKIVVKNVDKTFTVAIRGGEGDDRIIGTSDRNIGGIGDEGDDIIMVSGDGTVGAFGGPGADKLIVDSKSGIIFQNLPSNEPDGKKDLLDCKNVLGTVAYISPRDGDVAVHCQNIKTGPFP